MNLIRFISIRVFIPLLFVGMSLANSLQINIPEDYLERVNSLDSAVFVPLREQSNADLQARLDQIINSNPQWRQLVRNKRMAVSLVNMADTLQSGLAHVNGDHMMYAASLPKIAVLLAAMDALEKGKPARSVEVSGEDKGAWKKLQLLTSKPTLFVCNVDEDSASNGNNYSQKVEKMAAEQIL